jgi:uncharacterized membrane protein
MRNLLDIIAAAAVVLFVRIKAISQQQQQFSLYEYIKAMVVSHSMDITALHFGYQISKETFSVLWKQEDVSASFDLKMRKLVLLSF